MSNLLSELPERIQFNIFSCCDSKSLFYLITTCRDLWIAATTNSALWNHQLYAVGWPQYLTQEIFFSEQQQQKLQTESKKQQTIKKRRKTNSKNSLFSSCCREFNFFQRYQNVHHQIINEGNPTLKKTQNRVFSALWSEIADVACLTRYCYPYQNNSILSRNRNWSFDIMLTNGQFQTQAYLNVDHKHSSNFCGIDASFVDPSEGIMNGVYFRFAANRFFQRRDEERAFYWDLNNSQDGDDMNSQEEYDWEDHVTKFTAGRLCSIPFYYLSLKQPVVPFSHSLYGKVFIGTNPVIILRLDDMIGHKSFSSISQDKKVEWKFNESHDWILYDIGESPSYPPFCVVRTHTDGQISSKEYSLVDLEQQKSIFQIEKDRFNTSIIIPQLPQVSNLCMVGDDISGYRIYDIRKPSATNNDVVGWIAGPKNTNTTKFWLDNRKAMFATFKGHIAHCDFRMLNGADSKVKPSSLFSYYKDHQFFNHDIQFQWHSYLISEGNQRAKLYSFGL